MNVAAIILGLTDAAILILERVGSLRQIAAQSGELTPEQELELDTKMAAAFAQAKWQPSTPPE